MKKPGNLLLPVTSVRGSRSTRWNARSARV